MIRLIIKFLLLGGVVYLCAEFLSGVSVDGYKSAVIAALVLALVNTFVKPIFQILSFPITILTLGIFLFVINALMVTLMDYFVGGFSVNSFWWALLMSFIISSATSFLNDKLKPKIKHEQY